MTAAVLRRQGVEIVEGKWAIQVEEGWVELDDGQPVPANACFWGGGIQPSRALTLMNGVGHTAPGFLRANLSLELLDPEGRPVPGWFGCGDAVVLEDEGRPVPMMHGRVLEPFWQAKIVAQNVLGSVEGKPVARRYQPRASFPHGISTGRSSLVLMGGQVRDLGRVAIWGRRQLGAWWARRYA